MGLGEAISDKKIIENAVGGLTKIAGQKPVVTKAKKAIAGFKIRRGYPIGAMVTLRGERMFEFPRSFRHRGPAARARSSGGVSGRSFDGRGNYNIGVKEQDHFPRNRVRQDRRTAWSEYQHQPTTAKNDEEAKALLGAFKFPFRN
ncbi:large ribosomal subunit protein uL5 [Cupriavidus basilensis]